MDRDLMGYVTNEMHTLSHTVTLPFDIHDFQIRSERRPNSRYASLSRCRKEVADAEWRLVLCNAAYLEMYGLPPDLVERGCSVRDVLESKVKAGTFLGDIDRAVDDIRARIASGDTVRYLEEWIDGRVIAIESEREFGLSVLERLDLELRQRGDRFRNLGVQDLPGFRKAEPAARRSCAAENSARLPPPTSSRRCVVKPAGR